MNNYDTNSDRRQIHTISETNTFLTKMYALMGGAVLVSALAAYLTMTVFRSAVMNMPVAMMWLILFVPFGLSMGISFKADRSPVASLVMLTILAGIYGFEFALIAGFYTGTQITLPLSQQLPSLLLWLCLVLSLKGILATGMPT